MKILFYGDSITDMGRYRDHSNDPFAYGHGYVFLATKELHERNYAKYQIINKGISGNRLIDLLDRYNDDLKPFNPDIVSILIGVNDVWHGIYDKTKKVSLKTFEEQYRLLINKIKTDFPNAKIIVCEPFILKGQATIDKWDEFTKVYKNARIVKRLAKEFNLPIVLLQKAFEKEADKIGVEPLLYDGVHPNVLGANLIAKKWLKVFYKQIDQ